MMRRRALLPWNAPLAGMPLLCLDWLLVVIREGEPYQLNWLYRGQPLWKSSANADLIWKLPIPKPPSAEPLELSLQPWQGCSDNSTSSTFSTKFDTPRN